MCLLFKVACAGRLNLFRNPHSKSVVAAVMKYVDAGTPGNDYWNVGSLLRFSNRIMAHVYIVHP